MSEKKATNRSPRQLLVFKQSELRQLEEICTSLERNKSDAVRYAIVTLHDMISRRQEGYDIAYIKRDDPADLRRVDYFWVVHAQPFPKKGEPR